QPLGGAMFKEPWNYEGSIRGVRRGGGEIHRCDAFKIPRTFPISPRGLRQSVRFVLRHGLAEAAPDRRDGGAEFPASQRQTNPSAQHHAVCLEVFAKHRGGTAVVDEVWRIQVLRCRFFRCFCARSICFWSLFAVLMSRTFFH